MPTPGGARRQINLISADSTHYVPRGVHKIASVVPLPAPRAVNEPVKVHFKEFTNFTANSMKDWTYACRVGMRSSGELAVQSFRLADGAGRNKTVYLVGGQDDLAAKFAQLQAAFIRPGFQQWRRFGEAYAIPAADPRLLCWSYTEHFMWSLCQPVAEAALRTLESVLN